MRSFNLRQHKGNRRGSEIVEAAMVLPVTILIMAALIGLVLRFYTGLLEQTEQHRQQREELYLQKEVTVLRLRSNLQFSDGEVTEE